MWFLAVGIEASLTVAMPVAGLFGWACVAVVGWWLLWSHLIALAQLSYLCSLKFLPQWLAEPGSDRALGKRSKAYVSLSFPHSDNMPEMIPFVSERFWFHLFSLGPAAFGLVLRYHGVVWCA